MVNEGGYISWSGNNDGFYACHGNPTSNMDLYLHPQKNENCQKVYAKNSYARNPL